jgi:hypothetical protein
MGHSISKAAELHKLFAHEDKTTKKIYQSAFTQFNEDVKAFYGDAPRFAEKSILFDLDKAALKIKVQISKAEKDEQLKDKIQSTKQFLKAQKELLKIKNQIVIEKNLKYKEDKEKIDALKLQELGLLKQTLFFTAKIDGEKSSPELLKSIKKQAEEKVEKNHKKNEGNNNSNDDSKSNKGKGNSGKGSDNSGKGNSGKDNSGKSNSGKAKGK